jgi:hypothetical protein
MSNRVDFCYKRLFSHRFIRSHRIAAYGSMRHRSPNGVFVALWIQGKDLPKANFVVGEGEGMGDAALQQKG